jgi:hypothetical protein
MVSPARPSASARTHARKSNLTVSWATVPVMPTHPSRYLQRSAAVIILGITVGVVFLFRRSTALRGKAGIWPVDGNTWSGYPIQYGEPRIPGLPRRKRTNSAAGQFCWRCKLPILRR